jgi:hypothetical protein
MGQWMVVLLSCGCVALFRFLNIIQQFESQQHDYFRQRRKSSTLSNFFYSLGIVADNEKGLAAVWVFEKYLA